MSNFEVIGDDVMGDVMGDEDEDEIVGVVTRSGMVRRMPAAPGGRGQRLHPIAKRPAWRNQLAPGVIQADEGMIPLPLTGQAGSPSGTFSATLAQITFQGSLQKPFRAERLLVSTVRTGASSVGRLLTLPFVGTDLQLADINGIDAELVGAQGAFGTRMTMKAAEPGVLIRLQVTLSTPLAGTDTIFATMMFMGRVIH